MQKSNAKPANVEINSLVLQSFESGMEKYIKNHSIWLEKLWFLPLVLGHKVFIRQALKEY